MSNHPTSSHEEEKLEAGILEEKKEIDELENILHREKGELRHLEEKLEHVHEHEPVTVKVNTVSVTFLKRTVTGLEIKETAIAQQVAIQPDFNLFEKKGEDMKPIKDDQLVHLKDDEEFRAVAPDDNSMA